MTNLLQKHWQEKRKTLVLYRSPQEQYDVFGQSVRQDGLQGGRAIAAMLGETGSAWVDCCGAVGGDEEYQGKGQFRILPDGSQTLNVYQALRHGLCD